MKNVKNPFLIISATLFFFILCCFFQPIFNYTIEAAESGSVKTSETVSFPTKSVRGLFVNTSPAFAVSYPDNWQERKPESTYGFVFRVEDKQGFPSMRISVSSADMCAPLKYSTSLHIFGLSHVGKEIKLIYEKETELEDGRYALEMEVEWLENTGNRINTYFLTAKKECTWITVAVSNNKGSIDDKLKKYAYSLKIKPEEGPSKDKEDIYFPAKLIEPVKSAKKREHFPQAKAQNIDEALLNEASRMLSEHNDTICLLVERNGMIVMEKYFHGNIAERNFDVRSVTKSVTSILIGIAIDKGFIKSINQPISAFLNKIVKDLPADKGRITIRDLLTMSSGLPWHEIKSAKQDYIPWVSSPNQLRWMLDKPFEYSPGTHWNYNTGASHILSIVVQEATGMTTREFAQKYLFDLIGFQIRNWSCDKQGYNYGGHGICLNGRSMIKIGRIFLNKGKYNGKQVISSNWTTESVKNRFTTNNALPWTEGYGYLWWTGKDLITGLSYFMAIGFGGQFIICVPSKNAVIAAGTEWLNFPNAYQNWNFVLLTILQYIFPAMH